MCDWEGCTTGTIGLPNPNQSSVGKTSGFLHPYIHRYTARAFPRERFLALEGEGITWMEQPSRQGIALFSVRIEFWRSTGGFMTLSLTESEDRRSELQSRLAGLGDFRSGR